MKRPKSAYSVTSDRVQKPRLARDCTDDADVALGWRVKACYINERRVWESVKEGRPVTYRPPAKYDGTDGSYIDGDRKAVVEPPHENVWLALVLWCQANDIPPEAYVRLQFEFLPIMARCAPEPKQLRAEKYLEQWQHYAPLVYERIRNALHAQKQRAESFFWSRKGMGNTTKQLWVRTINNAALELSPLFRYCLASSLGGKTFQSIADRYEDRAILQFERHRDAYLATWKAILPRGFAERSAKLYPELLAR